MRPVPCPHRRLFRPTLGSACVAAQLVCALPAYGQADSTQPGDTRLAALNQPAEPNPDAPTVYRSDAAFFRSGYDFITAEIAPEVDALCAAHPDRADELRVAIDGLVRANTTFGNPWNDKPAAARHARRTLEKAGAEPPVYIRTRIAARLAWDLIRRDVVDDNRDELAAYALDVAASIDRMREQGCHPLLIATELTGLRRFLAELHTPDDPAAVNAARRAIDAFVEAAALDRTPEPAREWVGRKIWQHAGELDSTLTRAEQRELCERLESTADVDPWIADLARGGWHVVRAWDLRGVGRAHTVTDDGWQGFAEHMTAAYACYTRAHERAPHRPLAADELIRIAMAGHAPGGTSEMVEWFETATAARPGHFHAYDNLEWALRPRWHGSIEMLAGLALHAIDEAEAGVADVAVPMEVLSALGYEIDDFAALWQDPAISEPMNRLVIDLLADPPEHVDRSVRLNTGQIIAVQCWRTGDIDTFARLVELTSSRRGPDAGWGFVDPWYERDASLLRLPRFGEGRLGETESPAALKAITRRDFAAARELLTPLLRRAASLPPHVSYAKRALSESVSGLALMEAIDSGEPTNVLEVLSRPDVPGPVLVHAGRWLPETDRQGDTFNAGHYTLAPTGDGRLYIAATPYPMPEAYETTVRIMRAPTDTPPNPDSEAWSGGFRLAWDAAQGQWGGHTVAIHSRLRELHLGTYNSARLIVRELPEPNHDGSYTLTVRCAPETLTVEVNGETLYTGEWPGDERFGRYLALSPLKKPESEHADAVGVRFEDFIITRLDPDDVTPRRPGSKPRF